MSIVIKLDTPAMNVLFPEGSTARVELQSAVLAEIVSKNLKPAWVGEAVTSQIKAAQTAAVAEVMREMGFSSHGYQKSNLVLPDSLRLKFKEEAREAVASAVAPLIREAVIERSADIAAGSRFDITRMVESKLDAEINAQVKAKVLAALSSALG
jgi:hypothetical protein